MKPAICTQCGARITVDENKSEGFCSYCGTPFITETVINNYQTTNVNNVTKIILGNEKDEGSDFFNRGITFLNLKEYNDAEENFKKAIETSPENAKFWFYLVVATTENFTNLSSLFSFTDYISDVKQSWAYTYKREHLCKEMKSFFALATNKQIEELATQFGFEFDNEFSFIKSIVKRFINGPINCVYNEIIPRIAHTFTPNPVINGEWYIYDVDALPENGGVFKSASVKTITVTDPEKLSKKFTKIKIDKNLANFFSQGLTYYHFQNPVKLNCTKVFEVVEFENGCFLDSISKLSSLAKRAVVLPDEYVEFITTDKQIQRRLADDAYSLDFEKGSVSSEVVIYGQKPFYLYTGHGTLMGDMPFYPVASTSEQKKKFTENLVYLMGEDFVKKHKPLHADSNYSMYQKAKKAIQKEQKLSTDKPDKKGLFARIFKK